jgi:hypothetical protein
LTARGFNKGSWREFPGENWLVLHKAEWTKFLPPEAAVGKAWDVDGEVAGRLLTYFYPQTENNNVRTNRIDQQTLKATVVEVKDGVVRVRLDGSLKMKHRFYPGRDDTMFVDATVVGYVDCDPARQQLRALRLVTDRATYGKEGFTVVVRSVK